MRTAAYRHLVCVTILLGHSTLGFGADEKAQREFFEKKIRPVLVKHCYQCHSADSKDIGGNLLLDHKDGMRSGGSSGPAVIAGKPSESLLIQALRYESSEMPPDAPLPETVIRDFEEWVSHGAFDPRETTEPSEAPELDPETHWSFYPHKSYEPPAVKSTDWPRDRIDQFILAKIEKSNLTPAQDAPPRTLIRRLYFDLIGLPPTLDQIRAFEADCEIDRQSAVTALVDDLLARSQFGERWGQHWLDVARFGESNGNDGLGRNATFPHAWRYRDYVINAFNDGTPYDRFLTEQIAGDLLPAETAEQRNRQLVATGFLAIGSKPASAMNKNFLMDIVDDQINAVCTAVMGLSVACARCHDHKHDPIPTRDYYAMAGIFRSTDSLYGLAGNEKLTAPPTELLKLKDKWNPNQKKVDRKDVPQFPESFSKTVEDLKPDLYEIFDHAPETLKVKSETKFTPDAFAELKDNELRGEFPENSDSYTISFWFKNNLKNEERAITGYLFSRAKLGDKSLPGEHLGIGGNYKKDRTGRLFVFNGNNDKKVSVGGNTVIPPGTWNHVLLVRSKDHVQVYLNGAEKPEIDAEIPNTFGENREFCLADRSDHFTPLNGNLAHFALFGRALSKAEYHKLYAESGQPQGESNSVIGVAMGVRENSKIEDCKVHVNGDGGKLGDLVPRGVLSVYQETNDSSDMPVLSQINKNQSGRLQLADWLTDPDHPQTARVFVNRVWLHLMGHGIVSTPDDFGVYGARPSHPELLDDLAQRFIDDGWSIKNLIRTIVLSRTYQLDSLCSPELVQADPNNVFFARHTRRRLDAESLRDGMLAVSGQLELSPVQGPAIPLEDRLINKPTDDQEILHQPSVHRSIYLCRLRHAPPPELAHFDLPDGVSVTGQRNQTVLPTQTLYLLNNAFVIDQAEALAVQVLSKPNLDDRQRVAQLFQRALLRSPSAQEIERTLATLQSISTILDESEETERRIWASVSQSLLATSEFRFVD